MESWGRLTPFELQLAAHVYEKKLRDDAKADRANIYTLATLIRTAVWTKHSMPAYAQVFPGDVTHEEMSDEAMYEMARSLNKLFGGKEV